MPRVLADTTVLYAAAYRRDSSHETGLSVVRGIDDETLPEAVVLDYVLAETRNGLPPTLVTTQPSTFSIESTRTVGFTSNPLRPMLA